MPALRKIRSFGLALGVILWTVAITGGVSWLYARNFAAGEAGSPPDSWPRDSRVDRASEGYTLVVALHPECPCSSATVDELAGILERTEGRLAARVLMMRYDDIDGRPEDSALWKQAARIPGVTLLVDEHGEEIRRFEAKTSGETRLYDPSGRLLFKGGITLGRGHAGENPGGRAVGSLVLNRARTGAPSTPVFGCAL